MWSSLVETNMCSVSLSSVYICIDQLSRGGGGGRPLTSLTPLLPHTLFCASPKPAPWFPTSHVVVFLCSVSSIKMNSDRSLCFQNMQLQCHMFSCICGGNRNTRRNHRPAISHWQTLSHIVVSSTPLRGERDSNSHK